MKPEVIQAFVGAARDVLAQEMGEPIEPQKVKLQGGPYQTDEVTVIIGLAQDIEGSVILSMSLAMSCNYISSIMGEPVTELDELAQSGIGELANVIAGRAGIALGEKGHDVVISPPTILIGSKSTLSTLGLQRLVVPVITPMGTIEVQIAAKENK